MDRKLIYSITRTTQRFNNQLCLCSITKQGFYLYSHFYGNIAISLFTDKKR